MASIRKVKKTLKKHDLYAIFDKPLQRDILITQFDKVEFKKSGIIYESKGFEIKPFIAYKRMGSVEIYNHI